MNTEEKQEIREALREVLMEDETIELLKARLGDTVKLKFVPMGETQMNETPEISKEQNPQILRYTIEQNIIRLQLSKVALAEFLEFERGGRLEDIYKEFFGYFRLVVGLTTALQDVDANSEIVKKVIDFLQPPSSKKLWSSSDDSEAIQRSYDGLALAQEYMNYLGSKGILSISR